MRRVTILGLVFAGCAAVVGCTHTLGRDFAAPQSDSLVLGTTTPNEVEATYGTPFKEISQVLSSANANPNAPHGPLDFVQVDGTYNLLVYLFSEAQPPIYGGGVAAKELTLLFKDGKLISYAYSSSFPPDFRAIDDAAVSSIVKGTTTRAEIVRMFGPPTGRAIYPALRDKGNDKFYYASIQRDKDNNRQTVKNLVVLFDPRGVVVDLGFKSDTGPIPMQHVVTGGTYSAPIFIPMKK